MSYCYAYLSRCHVINLPAVIIDSVAMVLSRDIHSLLLIPQEVVADLGSWGNGVVLLALSVVITDTTVVVMCNCVLLAYCY